MGKSFNFGVLLFSSLILVTACNPQEQLGVGVSADEVDLPGDSPTVFSGLSFMDGKLLISKAINRDLFGSMGSKYCFDNSDTRYGCKRATGSNRDPVFFRSIQFSLMNRSKMFGLSLEDELEVSFPGATVTTAVPVQNPDTGDFVYTQREKYRYDADNPEGVKVVSASDVSCVPGTNGAVGFADRPGYALNGLHVFEEGIDATTSMSGLFPGQVDFTFFKVSEGSGGLSVSAIGEASIGEVPAEFTTAGNTLSQSPKLKANDVFDPNDDQLPRVITGFCLRSAKKADTTTGDSKNLIRVGLFGVRGVFYKARFR
jgi:hypothetical protein